MGAKNIKENSKSDRWAAVSLILTTLAVINISICCFSFGWFFVHQNLFYIPIVLACIFFGRKGFIFSVILSFVYFSLILCFTKDITIISQALARVFVFGIIAGIVTFLSIKQKRTEEKLLNTSAQLKSVINSSSQVSIISTDLSGRILTFNSGAERMLGYSAKEMMDKTPVFYHLESEMTARGRELSKELGYPVEGFDVLVAYAKKGGHETREWTYVRKDGEHLIVNITVTPVRNDAGETIGFMGVASDITERRKKEEELYKLNRTLRAISNSNQAMMRAEDESSFLKEVCEIIIRDCGHAMVWIGFAENDKNKTVRPAVCAGFEQGYLETLNITWADTERGQGPTGTAIRTGKAAMCRNILTDPKFKPWRQEAIKRGYASSIVLPLISNNKTFGALNIYSKEPDPYTADEVKLLSELADDLAYGVTSIRMRIVNTQAQEALRKREEELRRVRYTRSLIEASPDPLATISPEGKITDVNEAAVKVTGLSRQELIGTDFSNYFTEPEKAREVYQQVFAEGLVTDYPLTIRHKDGRLIDVIYSATVYCDEQDKVIGVFAAARDITERKKAEEKLKESESTLKGITTAMPIGLGLTSNRIIKWVNDYFPQLTGYQKEEIIGKSTHILYENDEGYNLVGSQYYRDLKEKGRAEIEVNWKRKNGEILNILFTGAPLDKEDISRGIVFTAMDITERKQVEQERQELTAELESHRIELEMQNEDLRRAHSELEKNRSKYSNLYDFAPVGHFTFDKNGLIIEANLTGCEMLGAERSFLIKKPFHLYVSKDSQDTYYLHRHSVLDAETRQICEITLVRKDKSTFEAQLISIKAGDADGNFTLCLTAVTDITERKKTEEKMKEIMQIKSEFTSMVSHELRSPLGAIKEGINLVLEGLAGDINEEQKDLLATAKRNTDRLGRLINNVLDFQKIESGKMDFDFKENDINETVQEVCKDLGLLAKEKGLDLVVDMDDGIPRIKFDKDKILQVLTNLVHNALKYTEKGQVTVHTKLENTKVHITVQDTGMGINAEDKERLFRAFEQLPGTKDKQKGGSGLGLAISKEIVLAHNGEIWAEAEADKGSVFHFTIPRLHKKKKKIGEILVGEGKITEEDLKKALANQERSDYVQKNISC